MAVKIKGRMNSGIIWIMILILIGIAGCEAPPGLFKIGVISSSEIGNMAYEGFKKQMAESGYSEGNNISYIFKVVNEQDDKDVDAGIRELLAQNIEILLTFGRNGAIRAKDIVKGTDIPVLFCGDAWPVEDGLVETLNHPGGNITGVRPANSTAKALEWLIKISPGVKKIWVAYNPDEDISMAEMPNLEKAASQLGLEMDIQKIHSVKEAVTAIENLPKDVNAIFRIPSQTLDYKSGEISRAAIKKGIPSGASILADEAVLITLTNDFFNAGEKAARLAQQIHQGIKPADLPVETSEVKLIINLKTAEKIGLAIPDNILSQATTIIR